MTALLSRATLRIVAHGIPAPQGSKNARPIYKGRGEKRVFTGKVNQVESSKKVAPWREAVAAAATLAVRRARWVTLDEPTAAAITFYMPRPKAHYGTGRNAGVLKPSAPTWCISQGDGDIDKVVRSTFDALTTAKVWVDDSRAAVLETKQMYVPAGEQPGAHIFILPLEEGAGE